MNLCQVVSTVTPLPSFLPPSSRVLRVIQPLRSIPCPFPPFARFFPLFYYFLDNLSLSLLAPSRLESTLLPVERLSGRKVNSMVFGKGRSERINPVSRFYDFLKKKSQKVYTVFLPPPFGACGSLRTNTRLPSFFTVFFFPFLRSGNSGTDCFTLSFFRVIGDRSLPCKSLGYTLPFSS